MSVLVLRDPIFDLFWQANRKSNDFEDQVIQCPKLTYLTLEFLVKTIIRTYFILKESEDRNTPNFDYNGIVDLAKYLKPCREIFARTSMFQDYVKILPSDIANVYDCKFLLWLCFENIESKELSVKICYFKTAEDDLTKYLVKFEHKKFNHVIKMCKYQKLDCQKLKLIIDHSDIASNIGDDSGLEALTDQNIVENSTIEVQDFKNTSDFFENIPHLRELNLDVKFREINQRLLEEILWKYPYLTNLTLALHCENDVNSFHDFIYKCNKKIEILGIKFGTYINIRSIDITLSSLRNLPKLKFVKLDFTEYDIGTLYNVFHHQLQIPLVQNPINFVKSISVKSTNMKMLKIIDCHFTEVSKLIIDSQELAKEYQGWSPEWMDSDFHDLDLINLKSVNTFRILKSKYELFGNISCPMIFQAFPNLEDLWIDKFRINESPVQEMDTLKKLTLLEGTLSPKLVYKMPNLERLCMKWPKFETQVNKMELVKALRRCLKNDSKIYEIIGNEEKELKC